MADNKKTLELISNAKGQFTAAMPKFFKNNSTRFFMAISNEFRKTPRLLECTPETLIGAIGSAATLALEFGPSGHCYMIPFDTYKKEKKNGQWVNAVGEDGRWLVEKTECQLIIGYKGYLNLYMRNPNIHDVYTYLVYNHDHFKIKYGSHPSIEHEPFFKPGRELIGGYCMVKFKTTNRFVYLTKDDFEKSRAASKAGADSKSGKTKPSGPWIDHYEKMCSKTCYKAMKNHIDWAPELAQLFQYDETIGSSFSLEDRETIDINHEEVKKHNESVRHKDTEDMLKTARTTESKDA